MFIVSFLALLVLIMLFVREVISLLMALFDKKASAVPLHILGTITSALLVFYMIIIVFKLEFSSDLFVSIILALSIVFFFACAISTFFVKVKNYKSKRKKQTIKENKLSKEFDSESI